MLEEFIAAEKLLAAAGVLAGPPPTPLEAVMEYMAGKGLGLHYYDPQEAPVPVKSAALGVDEVLVRQEKGAVLFVNRDRPETRRRFSIFHGIAHFLLPGHQNLDYLGRGCTSLIPGTTKPYERQADRFAAGMNMPPHRFRDDMSRLSFTMQAVEELAHRYLASVESAAIHHINLADAPCALLWLEPNYDEEGFVRPESPLRVRYQVRSTGFPFYIRSGTRVPLDSEIFWQCSENQSLVGGVIPGTHLGLRPDVELVVDCLPQGHLGAVLVLVCQGSSPPSSAVDPLWE